MGDIVDAVAIEIGGGGDTTTPQVCDKPLGVVVEDDPRKLTLDDAAIGVGIIPTEDDEIGESITMKSPTSYSR
ncbi:MAG: hypothetical protein HC927_04230 [Deltaproteobacteria bacterium]|nr:hypothetical protein [Deltaproteobacteria bacterium]